MAPALLKRQTLVPFLVACFIGAVWVNQGVSAARVDALRAESVAAPEGEKMGAVRFILLNLYKRAGDEEIYFAVTSAMRGLPYDHERLMTRGRDTPALFQRAPPEDGHWHQPYAEVPYEYPAATLPFILLPSFLSGGSFAVYTRIFGALMCALLLAAASLAMRAQPGRSDRERWWWMGAMLLAQGALSVERLDAVLALALAWALCAAAERKFASAGVAMGVATAAKFLPALLAAPLVAIDRAAWRTADLARAAIGLTVTVVVGFVPMLLLPGAFFDVLRYHAARGLQVESTYAVLVSSWRLVTGTLVPSVYSFGSFNLEGAAASFFARAAMPLTLLLIAALTAWCARCGEPEDDVARRDRLALSLLAGVTALWLSAKVFSPQYLTWAMPLVLAVSGKRGRTLTWLLFAIMWITQYVIAGDYDSVMHQHAIGVVALMVRLPLLVLFAVVTLRGLGRPAPAPVTAVA